MIMKINKDKIYDLSIVEYRWIETMLSEGLTEKEINKMIVRCLGGDEESSNIMIKVTLRLCEPQKLIDYLNSKNF